MRRIKTIKKITYTILVLSLILVACGGKDQEAAERLSQLNVEVESLYNEEMNDLREELSTEDFDKVEASIEVEAKDKEEFNKENTETLEKIESLYQNAVVMHELDNEIQELFNEEILHEKVEMEEIDDLSTRLSEIDGEQWTVYVNRQEEMLNEARAQLVTIQDAEELVNKLSFEDGKVSAEATREGEKAAQDAVSQIKNESIRALYEKRLEDVDEVLTALEVERKKATEGVGHFGGMYLSSDNILLYIDNKKTIFAENIVSDNSAYYEIRKVINNTGKELTVEVYEYPDEAFGIEGGITRDTYYLSDDHQTVTYEDVRKFQRLSQSEQDEVFYRLPGLKNMIENNHPWND